MNDQYVAAIATADQLRVVRDQVIKDYNAIPQEDRDRLDKMIPSTVDNVRLIIDLNSVALQHGFSLHNMKAAASASTQNALPAANQPAFNPSAPIQTGSDLNLSTPTLDTVDISFSVTAPYLGFQSFMQDLEANLRIMDITHLTVTANDTGTYDFGVQLKTYWLRQ